MSDHRCMFCGFSVTCVGDVCPCCEVVVEAGRFAKRNMFPMESCPWINGYDELVDIYGDPKHHDDEPLGKRGSCPWCSGWAEAERELFEKVKGGKA